MRRAGLVLTLLVGTAGCAIQADSGPRDVPEDHPARVAIAAAVEGGEATGEGRIYLLAPEASAQPLRTVLRDTNAAQELIETLGRGPNQDELADGLSTALPASLEVSSVQFDGGVVNVDVAEDLADLTDERLQLAVAQIVFTASELPGADGVVIRVAGETRPWPDGQGDLQSDPLTVYDFIGYAESSQPPYPVTPRTATNPVPPTTTAPSSTATTAPGAATTTAATTAAS